jgi:small subunit ribosomal protein S17
MAGKAEKQGVVVSDKMQKSVIVSTERRVQHDVYGKTQKRTSTFVAHDRSASASDGHWCASSSALRRVKETTP